MVRLREFSTQIFHKRLKKDSLEKNVSPEIWGF